MVWRAEASWDCSPRGFGQAVPGRRGRGDAGTPDPANISVAWLSIGLGRYLIRADTFKMHFVEIRMHSTYDAKKTFGWKRNR